MKQPTQEELDITRKTLEFFLADTEENEPYAINTITALECILSEFSFYAQQRRKDNE